MILPVSKAWLVSQKATLQAIIKDSAEPTEQIAVLADIADWLDEQINALPKDESCNHSSVPL